MAEELKDVEVKVRDSKAIRQKLNELKNEEGLLKPEVVVEEASNPDSPLHKAGPFKWDDEAGAAHQWRLHVARTIIRKLVITRPDDSTETPMPKYVSLVADRRKPGGGYRETTQVLSNQDLIAELERTAKKDIEGVLRRYQMLKDLCEKVRKVIS